MHCRIPALHCAQRAMGSATARTSLACGHADRHARMHARCTDRQCLSDRGVGQGAVDGGDAESGEGDDVAGGCVGHLDLLEAASGDDLHALHLLELLVAVAEGDQLVADLDRAGLDASQQQLAQELVALDLGDSHAEGRRSVQRRRLHVRHHRLEQGVHIRSHRLGLEGGPAVARARVDNRELHLRVRRLQVDEQVEDLVLDLADARGRSVHLVDHHDRAQAHLERLGQHELGLRHRTVRRVDHQRNAVDHRQHALHLTWSHQSSGQAGGACRQIGNGTARNALQWLERRAIHAAAAPGTGSQRSSVRRSMLCVSPFGRQCVLCSVLRCSLSHLSTEICVSGRVDDVDVVLLLVDGILPHNRRA